MAAIPKSDTGNEALAELDRRHRALLKRLTFIDRALALGAGAATLGRMLAELKHELDSYYVAEDALLRANVAPRSEEHAAAHVELSATIESLRTGLSGTDATAAARSVRDKVLEHLLSFDMDYKSAREAQRD